MKTQPMGVIMLKVMCQLLGVEVIEVDSGGWSVIYALSRAVGSLNVTILGDMEC